MEIWDGYFRDGTPAETDLVRGQPIPEGLYHLVSEILVRHTDGDFLLMQRHPGKPNYGGYYEATAGGSALKGEDALACARRELAEETGITAQELVPIGTFVSRDTLYAQFLCRTNCCKASIRLQPGETVGYQWLSEESFIAFINSGKMIETQRQRYTPYFQKMGYLK